MAVTQSNGLSDAVSGILVVNYLDTGNNAATLTPGFKPLKIEVYDETNANIFVYVDGMAAGKGFKTVTAGTTTFMSSNGFTVTGADSSPAAQPTVVLGTGIVAANAQLRIVMYR